jgi:hypothetical protein
MQFFITLGLLVTAAAAYLVYQYRSRAFIADDAADPPPQAEPADTTLKAA